jgi:hypothetical protein
MRAYAWACQKAQLMDSKATSLQNLQWDHNRKSLVGSMKRRLQAAFNPTKH